jgi:hypothetical protein
LLVDIFSTKVGVSQERLGVERWDLHQSICLFEYYRLESFFDLFGCFAGFVLLKKFSGIFLPNFRSFAGNKNGIFELSLSYSFRIYESHIRFLWPKKVYPIFREFF